jgi:DnaJ-class molecular chaperone
MAGGDHPTVELTVSVKAPCQECGGRGYIETVTAGGHIAADPTTECLTCSGRGLIPEDMPLSQFRELLESHFR